MAKAKYDWYAAGHAMHELRSATRAVDNHLAWRKRANVELDLLQVEMLARRIRMALLLSSDERQEAR